ncbi:MAG: non-hydrolyzing UDP-N-acetylglucosamine 2-epimerase, partial [Ilumatobacteraceae bacterium]
MSSDDIEQPAVIDLIVGARPNFVKIASIVHAWGPLAADGVRHRLIHTGQHFDTAMSGSLFEQLAIPEPEINLGVRAPNSAAQIGAIMTAYAEILADHRPALTMVVGDVNSTAAAAIAAQHAQVPVAHVESGLRSGAWQMPEEINRLVTDSIADLHFATTDGARDNLLSEGVDPACIHVVGNTMIDTLIANRDRAIAPEFWSALGDDRPFVLATLHRPSNVDDTDRLVQFISALCSGAGDLSVVLPAHPRIRERIAAAPGLPGNLMVVEPQPYLEFMYLLQRSALVVTDSGGITEETYALDIPCISLRSTTERPETVTDGTTVLAGEEPDVLPGLIAEALAANRAPTTLPPTWDGGTGARIVEVIRACLRDGFANP